jgi:hypothetical protein
MKQLVKGYIYYVKYDFAQEPLLRWNESKTMGKSDPDWVMVGPHNFTIEVSDDFDPRPKQLAAIDEKIASVRAEMTARITELMEQRSRLLAIENTVEA